MRISDWSSDVCSSDLIKYRQLQYFLAIAETLHFSKAAESLFVTQPTLSHQLSELEAQIGMPLFDRTGGTVRLTQAGKIFREYAARSINAIEERSEERRVGKECVRTRRYRGSRD